MNTSTVERDDQESSWRKDRQALLRYRLAAARYGLRIRLMRPYSDVLGIVGLLLAILGLALTLRIADLRIYGEVLGAALIVAVWPTIRYLGRISGIMRAAASTEDGTRRLFNDMREGMTNSHAYGQLRKIYKPLIDETNDSLRGWSWPCQFELAEIPQKDTSRPPGKYASVILPTSGLASLTGLLGNFRKDAPDMLRGERQAENRQRLMRRWRSLQRQKGMGDEEGGNYCLAEIRLEESEPSRLVLDLGVATYGQIARTSESLVNEFAFFAFITKGSRSASVNRYQSMRSSTMLRCLPWRRKTHQSAGSATALFIQPYNRAAGVGVAVTTIVTSAEGHRQVYVGERSETVGTYPNVLHVIPAGNCNTHGSQRRIEHMDRAALPDWYLRSIMRCEYLEEWFNDEDLETLRIPDWRARVDHLWTSKVTELSPIELTGLAFDLLNLRPEVCAEIEVKMTGNEVLNWEYTSSLPPEEWALSDIGDIDRSRIVQSAAAALLLARRAGEKSANKRIGKGAHDDIR
jgi:hypothetical protein